MIYKIIDGSRYSVCDNGEIRNNTNHHNVKPVCTIYLDKDGYERVWVNRKFVPVHRLVAKCFVPCWGDPNKLVVNHIDGNRRNNNATNLEWLVAADNERHARRVLGKRLLGEKASRSKLKSEQVKRIRVLSYNGKTTQQISAWYKISIAQVKRIVRRTNWSHI